MSVRPPPLSLSLSQEEEVCLYKSIQPPLFKTIAFPTQEEKPTLLKWWKVYSVCPIPELSGNRLEVTWFTRTRWLEHGVCRV